MKPFKPAFEAKVDTNFATTCDIWSSGNEDKFVVTGHRGFNGSGSEVKMWDLKKMVGSEDTPGTAETKYVFTNH